MLLTRLGIPVLYYVGCVLSAQIPFSAPIATDNLIITSEVDSFVEDVLKHYNSSGLSIAVVRRNESYPSGWLMEFGSYGVAKADGSPVTPDSLFAIASNSKLFLSLSVGLLIENQTLAAERGQKLSWKSRAIDVFPQWGLMDKDMERIVNFEDMLSHRTGMPRHDLSGRPLKGDVAEMISNLRFLRPSAEPRETWQYNNLMYETLSYLPKLLLHQPYESYVAENLFRPLNMTSSTYSVSDAEASGNLAHGHMRTMRDTLAEVNGTRTPMVPYFSRPGEETIWAGAGGVITSARDLSVWVAMLLGNGKHPFKNETVVSESLIKHVAEGVSVVDGAPSEPELSPTVYGAGQERYAYRGHEIIEHGGSNPGFKTQVSRFPHDNLGVVVLSNDEEFGTRIHDIVIRYIADRTFGLPPIDWKTRLDAKGAKTLTQDITAALPRPDTPTLPTHPIPSLEGSVFVHPAYGSLRPCYVGPNVQRSSHEECTNVLTEPPVRQIVQTPFTRNSTLEETLAIPTLIIPFKTFFATHIMLRHFNGNIFNGSIIWSNWAVREEEGYHHLAGGINGDVITGFDDRFEVEWVDASESSEEGLAFKGGGSKLKRLKGLVKIVLRYGLPRCDNDCVNAMYKQWYSLPDIASVLRFYHQLRIRMKQRYESGQKIHNERREELHN